MTTAQILFEQYKVLPKRIQRELKELIDEEEKPKNAVKSAVKPADVEEEDDDDNGDTIRISMKALKDSIREVKLLKAGKQKGRPARELIAEIRKEQANER